MLDPQRVKLTAANAGFLKRTHQHVDWDAFTTALQTDDGGCSRVRREANTPINELRIMGGEGEGYERNSLMLTNARQVRQMTAYPLRSFSADQPAIILPDKYGGLPMYTRDQLAYSDFVSVFTAPMSAPLQNDTALLGPQGFTASNESASNPFRPLGFEHNMHKTMAAIDYNEAANRQRKFLAMQSRTDATNKERSGDGGIFINSDGKPTAAVSDQLESAIDSRDAFSDRLARQSALQGDADGRKMLTVAFGSPNSLTTIQNGSKLGKVGLDVAYVEHGKGKTHTYFGQKTVATGVEGRIETDIKTQDMTVEKRYRGLKQPQRLSQNIIANTFSPELKMKVRRSAQGNFSNSLSDFNDDYSNSPALKSRSEMKENATAFSFAGLMRAQLAKNTESKKGEHKKGTRERIALGVLGSKSPAHAAKIALLRI